MKAEPIHDGVSGDDGGLHGGGAFAMHLDEVGNRLERRAVSNSLAQMAQDEAIEDSGRPPGDEGFEARDHAAMQAAAEKAADDVRLAWGRRRQQGDREATTRRRREVRGD
jgi:hypothetical protein